MSEEISVAIRKAATLEEFLELNGFSVEDLGGGNYSVTREDELAVMLNVTEGIMRFQVDICPTSTIDSKELYHKFLDLNTEVLPVSFGIDSTNASDPRLVLSESRLLSDLNDDELLCVFAALELATDRAEEVLTEALG